MNGFEAALKNKLLSVIPHVELLAYDKPINNWQAKLPALTAPARCRLPVPLIFSRMACSGLVVKSKRPGCVVLNCAYEEQISQLQQFVRAGQLNSLSGHQIVLGQGIATELRRRLLAITVQLMLPQLSQRW